MKDEGKSKIPINRENFQVADFFKERIKTLL